MISVVVPAFNAAATLESCLRALLAQELPEGESLEVLVVDNRSTDETAALARRFPVRLLTEESPGPAAARNRGLSEAQGDFIALIDADCEVPSHWMRRALESLRARPDVAAVGGPGRIPTPGLLARCLNGLHYGLSPRTPRRDVRSLATMNVLFRGEVLRGHRFDPRYFMGEDPELNLRLIDAGWKLLFDPELAVAHYHPITLSGIARKWFEYGLQYPLPYLRHRRWVFEAGLLPRMLYVPVLAATAVLGVWKPAFLLVTLALILALPAAYFVLGWRAVRGWDRLVFPWVHAVKQGAQLLGITIGCLRPGRRVRRSAVAEQARSRIVFLAGNLYPLLAQREDLAIVGGAEVQQILLARELRNLGLEVRFVVEDMGQGPLCVAGGFTLHGYGFGRDKIRQARTLWSALRAARPDVLCLRGIPRFVAVPLAYRSRFACPLVLSLSTNAEAYPRSLTGRGSLSEHFHRRALREADAVVVQTRFQGELLRTHFGRTDVRLIRSGIEVGPPPEAGLPRDIVAWIASIHPHKGVERLFDLARRLPELRFEAAGGPARNQEAYYREKQEEARAVPNLRWHGFVPHEGVDEILLRAFAFVNTTVPLRGISNLEGFPNVYLEAWRNGVPVLTVENDPDGLLRTRGSGLHCETLESLACELRNLAQDPLRREAMGKAARRSVEEEHDIRMSARHYQEIFREVPSHSPRASTAGRSAG